MVTIMQSKFIITLIIAGAFSSCSNPKTFNLDRKEKKMSDKYQIPSDQELKSKLTDLQFQVYSNDLAFHVPMS
jgi:hypothetical protein